MRPSYVALLAAVALSACDESGQPLDPTVDPQFASASSTGPAGAALYEVEITNLTEGQPMTPPLAVTHRPSIHVFHVGDPASLGIQEIAENGNLAPMLEALGESQHANDVVVAVADFPPLLPGEERTFTIETSRGAKFFSFASMLICTNDGFTGIDGLRLPKDVGESVSVDTNGYDAGTEINTEDFEDLVPPCGPLTGVDSGDAGTGASNPLLSEGGVIHHHAGIDGDADLLPDVHGWMDPVARVIVTRIQ